MNFFGQSLSHAGLWACGAFGAGVVLAVTGLLGSSAGEPRPRRRRRLPMSAAELVGEEGTWRRRFFAGLVCLLVFLPLRLVFFVLLALVVPMLLGMAAAVACASWAYYRQVASRALCRREGRRELESPGVFLLAWGVGLGLLWKRMRRRHGRRRGAGARGADDGRPRV